MHSAKEAGLPALQGSGVYSWERVSVVVHTVAGSQTACGAGGAHHVACIAGGRGRIWAACAVPRRGMG